MFAYIVLVNWRFSLAFNFWLFDFLVHHIRYDTDGTFHQLQRAVTVGFSHLYAPCSSIFLCYFLERFSNCSLIYIPFTGV